MPYRPRNAPAAARKTMRPPLPGALVCNASACNTPPFTLQRLIDHLLLLDAALAAKTLGHHFAA